MNAAQMSRFAASCLIAAIGSWVLVSQAKTDLNAMVAWWLLMVVSCGLALNSKEGERRKWLMAAAFGPALVPVVHVAFRALAADGDAPFHFSGVVSNNPRFWILVLFVIGVSWFAIFVFSYTGPFVRMIWKVATGGHLTDGVKKTEALVRALLALAGAVALLWAALRPG